MEAGFVGAMALVAAFGLVVASPVVAGVAWALSTRTDYFGDALGTVLAGAVGLFAAGAVALAVLVDPAAGLTFAVVAAGAALVLAVVPVLFGRQLLGRWTLLDADEALAYATLGWPVAMVTSAVLFVAPGGFTRYNVLFLDGLAATVAWTTLVLVVTLGPALAGLALYNAVERFARGRSARSGLR
ncbi:hypothetical protein I7X12_11360 [Halosimplex litoreum]|uniref:Uncharacterized protein n=1 Tax=Halosimplex litoreum TaxID=1198301 RepID=A0A7T3FVC5_9EURY|nr:hypothetical protein [Halosimplex litoreum]QPV61367.1 hypothetical protein I7X12_11360 [Halosimplex litoreum]